MAALKLMMSNLAKQPCLIPGATGDFGQQPQLIPRATDDGVEADDVPCRSSLRHLAQQPQCIPPSLTLLAGADGAVEADDVRCRPALQHLAQQPHVSVLLVRTCIAAYVFV